MKGLSPVHLWEPTSRTLVFLHFWSQIPEFFSWYLIWHFSAATMCPVFLSLCSLAGPHLLPACRSRVGNALKGSIHNWRKSSLYTLLIAGIPSLSRLQVSQPRTSTCRATHLSCITYVFTRPTILFEKEIILEI